MTYFETPATLEPDVINAYIKELKFHLPIHNFNMSYIKEVIINELLLTINITNKTHIISDGPAQNGLSYAITANSIFYETFNFVLMFNPMFSPTFVMY